MKNNQPYRELLAVHEAFRRLGFAADDLYVGFGTLMNVGSNVLYLELQTHGKNFRYSVAQILGASEADVRESWCALLRWAHGAAEDELAEIWYSSKIGSDENIFFRLIGTLLKRGFEVPVLAGNTEAQQEMIQYGAELPTTAPGGEA